MTQDVFASYAEQSIKGYAHENIVAGRWPEQGALERARQEFGARVPQGLATADHHFFEVRADEPGATVGYLWLAIEERRGVRGAYIYDVVIHAPFRRQGHAKRAFQLLEPLVRSLGASSIGLHVFVHNPGAQALYEQLGYQATGINMLKHLGPDA